MKNEKLMRAIGQIDEDLILEARQVAHPRRRYVRWGALAACLALLVLVSPLLLIGPMMVGGAKEEAEDLAKNEYYDADTVKGLFDIIFNFNNITTSGKYPPTVNAEMDGCTEDAAMTETLYSVGDEVKSDKGILTFTEMTDTSIRLHLIKLTDEDTVIKVSILCSSEDAKDTYADAFPSEEINIYVNGHPADELPREHGEYDILLDFTDLLTNPDLSLSRVFTVEGFGMFEGD